MSLADSLQHLELLSSKRARLEAAQMDAEDQLFFDLARRAASGELSDEDLTDIIEDTHPLLLRGWTRRWDDAGLKPSVASLRGKRRHSVMHAPNGPHGTWVGTWPLGEWPYDDTVVLPRFGQPVVYVLFDADNVPCYVGSTGEFKTRLKSHVRDGKPVARWVAHPCNDRESAYILEEKLLREHKPYLNKKVSR